MDDRFALIWEKVRTGLWPLPLATAVLAALLYAALGAVDRSVGPRLLEQVPWLYSGSGDDASNLLSTLVSGIITMSSVVFSITIVALTLAATQFGSRVIRLYMSDLRTKVALGIFTMTIVYCLLALRAIDRSMTPEQVPHVVVTGGFVLGLVCVLMLLLFLHFVGRSIVADEVIGRVSAELEKSIAALPRLPEGEPGQAAESAPPPGTAQRTGSGRPAQRVPSTREGYVQAIRYEDLVDLCAKSDLLLQLDVRAGDFVSRHGAMGTLHGASPVTPALAAAVQDAILIGEMRTPTQDLEFSIRQLVDVALRALSPGINDANTALVVIDRLRGALARLLSRALPGARWHDDAGVLRIVAKPNSYRGVIDAALNQIRQAAAPHPAVVIHMLQALAALAPYMQAREQQKALLHHADLVAAAGLRVSAEAHDRADIEDALRLATAALRGSADDAIDAAPGAPAPWQRGTPETGVDAAGEASS